MSVDFSSGSAGRNSPATMSRSRRDRLGENMMHLIQLSFSGFSAMALLSPVECVMQLANMRLQGSQHLSHLSPGCTILGASLIKPASRRARTIVSVFLLLGARKAEPKGRGERDAVWKITHS